MSQQDQSPASLPRTRRFVKAVDGRNHPVRGLWVRNGRFYARIKAEGTDGSLKARWVPLPGASTVAEAKTALRELFSKRDRQELVVAKAAPLFGDYVDVYVDRLKHSGKTLKTISTERGYLTFWRRRFAEVALNRIRPHMVNAALHELRAARKAPRTCNISLVCLRNVFKAARVDGFLTTLPTEGLRWFRTETKPRQLYAPADIDRLCAAAAGATKNAVQFVDYLRFLQFTGCREKEALSVRWQDVSLEGGHLVIGAQGGTKNREPRVIDLNQPLEAHLRAMWTRRAPDSQWLFPSPQRGARDIHAKSFRESLRLVRKTVREMESFGFHDLRHHFISYSIMSAVDFLTVARWVGHKDGGVLIGKVYGHLADEHRKRMAAQVTFAPVLVGEATRA